MTKDQGEQRKCKEWCNGSKDYTDGVFDYCRCAGEAMLVIVGADIRHKRTGKGMTVVLGGNKR